MPRFIKCGDNKKSKEQGTMDRVLFFVSTARNAIVVLVCAGLAAYLSSVGDVPFILTGGFCHSSLYGLACLCVYYGFGT